MGSSRCYGGTFHEMRTGRKVAMKLPVDSISIAQCTDADHELMTPSMKRMAGRNRCSGGSVLICSISIITLTKIKA